MRLFAATTAAAALLLSVPAIASAHPLASIGVPDPVANLQTSDNVTHIQRFPEHRASSGGRLFEGRFYITDANGLTVYDVADPLNPEKLGSLLVPQSTTGIALGQEDPDTNGEILLLDTANQAGPTGRLTIIDVSDPANMSVLSQVTQTSHTWTCINDCEWAYGRDGEIIDLRDPASPVLSDNCWRDVLEIGGCGGSGGGETYTHDVTFLGNNRAVSAGQLSTYFDTTDPEAPVALARNLTNFHTFGYHGVEWARGGTDELVVFGTEIAPDDATGEAGSDCQDEGSIIATYGAKQILEGEAAVAAGQSFGEREFELLDTWMVQGRGAFVDGQAPAHILYCAHWFNLHPEWSNGGLFAAGYYEWGTRLVEVAPDGTMSEYGWFLPSDGYTSAAYWISRDVLYTTDYVRGMDVIQVDVAAPADPSPEGEVASGDLDFEELPAPDADEVPATPVTGAGMVGLALGSLGAGWGLRLRRRR